MHLRHESWKLQLLTTSPIQAGCRGAGRPLPNPRMLRHGGGAPAIVRRGSCGCTNRGASACAQRRIKGQPRLVPGFGVRPTGSCRSCCCGGSNDQPQEELLSMPRTLFQNCVTSTATCQSATTTPMVARRRRLERCRPWRIPNWRGKAMLMRIVISYERWSWHYGIMVGWSVTSVVSRLGG